MDDRYTYKTDRSAERARERPMRSVSKAVRGGTIVGEHEVLSVVRMKLSRLSIRLIPKAIFGKGAIQAAKFLKGSEAGNVSDERCHWLAE